MKREYQRAFDVLENIANRNKKDIPKDVYVGFIGKVKTFYTFKFPFIVAQYVL